MSITPLPPAPAVTDTTSEFNTKAFNFVAALDPMVTEINAELPAISEAGDAATAAIGAANFKGEWSSLSGALAIPASVSHNGKVWLLTVSLANVALKEPGVASEWLDISPISSPVGALQYFAGATTTTYPGEEWLPCDGSVVTQAAYPDLFNIVGLVIDGFDNWTTRTSGTTSTINALIYGGGKYVYAGDGGVLATSTDGITWAAQSSGTIAKINKLTYANGLYILAGPGGLLNTSTDAVTWTVRTSGTTSEINALAYGASIYVYGGANTLGTSTNGITWTSRTPPSTFCGALTYGAGIFVYGGLSGFIATSTDAITWTTRTSPFGSQMRGLIYANNLFIGVDNGTLATSTNGITWTTQTTSGNTFLGGLSYGDGFYVVGIQTGGLRTSTDAITWVSRTSGTTSNIWTTAYGNGVHAYAGTGGVLKTTTPYTYNNATEFVLPVSDGIDLISPTSNNVFIKAE